METKPGELLQHWNDTVGGQLTTDSYQVRLPIEAAAKVEALAEMFPKSTTERLLGDLIASALYELEESMPYVQGDKVIAHDELGDEIYEDKGPTREFLTLSAQKLKELKAR